MTYLSQTLRWSMVGAVIFWASIVRAEPYEDAIARKDFSTALTLLRPVAERGNADAQAKLGIFYSKGLGVPVNATEAINWYRRAAHQGEAIGQLNLGLAYMKGSGVIVDYVEAYKWLTLTLVEPVPSDSVRELARAALAQLKTSFVLSNEQQREADRRVAAWRPVLECTKSQISNNFC